MALKFKVIMTTRLCSRSNSLATVILMMVLDQGGFSRRNGWKFQPGIPSLNCTGTYVKNGGFNFPFLNPFPES